MLTATKINRTSGAKRPYEETQTIMTTLLTRRSLAAAGLALLPGTGRAQAAYPGRQPISVVIPYPPGGIPDVFAQTITQGLQERLGGTFVSDHRPGGSTTIAARYTARAKPDGTTLMLSSIGSMVLGPLTVRNAGFDPLNDFTHLGMVGGALFFFVANPRWESLDAIVAAAKAKPGSITYASWGIGSAAHLAGVELGRRTGTEMVHVPYPGAAPSLLDVSQGRVDFSLTALTPAKPHLEGNRLRALGMATPVRFSQMPDIPTLTELGYKDFTVSNWTAVSAPAGLPPAIGETLQAALTQTFTDPAVVARLAPFGILPLPTGAQAMQAQLERDLEEHRVVLKQIGVEPT
jgi:tripartite-type tricarboxylate transporter receptor subunit TctC